MFKTGDIVKSKLENSIVFVAVIDDHVEVPEGYSRDAMFCGVVLKSNNNQYLMGESFVSFNISEFELSNSSEVSNYIP